MPVTIKLGLSVLTVLVARLPPYYKHVLGHRPHSYAVRLSLGLFMIFAMWPVSRVKREETAGGVRRDGASTMNSVNLCRYKKRNRKAALTKR